MPDPDRLPEHLRAAMARALDAVPEPSPRPDQARYARGGRRRAGGWPTLALASGVTAIAALAALAGFSTGSPNPAVWTGRAISAIHDAEPVPAPPATAPAPVPMPAAAPRARQATAAPTRPSPLPTGRVRLPFPPGFVPPPRFTPPPLSTGFPHPSPSPTSDSGRDGR